MVEKKNYYNKYLEEYSIGKIIRAIRESKRINANSLCYGICSASTLSKIENGDRVADYLTLNALFERLGVKVDNFEMLLDEKDYMYFNMRNEIDNAIVACDYELALKLLDNYAKKLNGNKNNLHDQFILIRKADIFLDTNVEKTDIYKLLEEALSCTVENYKERVNDKSLLSENELKCIFNLIDSYDSVIERSSQYESLISYCQYSKGRHGGPYDIYFKIVEKYAILLCEMKKYKRALRILEEAIDEISKKSDLLNKPELYYILGICNENLIDNNIDKNICIKNYLIAYNMYYFFGNYQKSNELKKHIEELMD